MNINELFSLKDKCAVVIGGAGKVGFPMAQALAEAGAKVFIGSRDESNFQSAAQTLRERGHDALGIFIDHSDEKSLEKSLEEITALSKTPDIMINASCSRPMKKFFEDTPENWDLSMAENSRGIFLSSKIFGKAMCEAKNGSIIHLSSIYGITGPDMNIYKNCDFETEPDYAFIKGGIISFTKYLASYFSSCGVRVNCISPGGIFNNQPEPFLSNYVSKTLTKRMGSSDDLKGITVFLASEASAYITGVNIPVDGGWTAI